jgi:hypothetical protein
LVIAPCNVEFFFLVNFTPFTSFNVGIYSPVGGKNEIKKKKNQHCMGRVRQKKIIEGKTKIRKYYKGY